MAGSNDKGLVISEGTRHAFGGQSGPVYDASDANAHVLMIDMEPGGAVHVPVVIAGVDIMGVDLGLFDGVTFPEMGVVDVDRDSAVMLGFTADDVAEIKLYGSTVFQLPDLTFINETANAKMTVGLTINQGANDDEAIALKSSDVAHGITSIAETDTYAVLEKHSATAGGLSMTGFSETVQAMILLGIAGTEDTTDTTTSNSAVELQGQLKSGTGGGALGATGNLLTVDNGGGTVRFLIKGDGTLHATNVTAGTVDGVALDGEDDTGLVRAWQRQRWDDAGIAMSKWDNMVQSNRDDLIRLGVLSSQGDFIKVQRMFDLQGGAIWQTYTLLMDVVAALPKSAKARLPEKIQSRLAALPQGA